MTSCDNLENSKHFFNSAIPSLTKTWVQTLKKSSKTYLTSLNSIWLLSFTFIAVDHRSPFCAGHLHICERPHLFWYWASSSSSMRPILVLTSGVCRLARLRLSNLDFVARSSRIKYWALKFDDPSRLSFSSNCQSLPWVGSPSIEPTAWRLQFMHCRIWDQH